MALPVDRFVTGEQDFAGLYNYSNRLEQNRMRDEQESQRSAARKFASDKYFTNYLDPKDRFTGTLVDPVNAELLGQALQQAYDLSAKGATDNEIFMAITPLVNKVNDYSQKAKQIQAQKKQAMDFLGKQKGIDPIKFSSEFDDEVFMETDPKTGIRKMKDLSLVDPSFNYTDKVLKDRDIYNPEGFDEYVAKSGKSTILEDVSVYGANKSMRRTKAEMTAPSFMISDKDERGAHTDFVPKYQVATDGDNVLMGDFLGKDGDKVQAPIRMVTNDVFNDLPASAKAYLRQEVRRLSKDKGVELNTAQAENLAKALAYDELKNSGKQYSTLKEVQVQKAAPASRINVNVNTGSTNVRDMYSSIKQKAAKAKEGMGYPLNHLSSAEQTQMLKIARDVLGNNNLTQADIAVKYNSADDSVSIILADGAFVAPLDFEGINMPVQPSVKEKREVISKGNKPQKQETRTFVFPSGKTKF